MSEISKPLVVMEWGERGSRWRLVYVPDPGGSFGAVEREGKDHMGGPQWNLADTVKAAIVESLIAAGAVREDKGEDALRLAVEEAESILRALEMDGPALKAYVEWRSKPVVRGIVERGVR